ncbi:MAG: hypothetical protein ACQETE_01720 [Bacteroidota bacterium]
MRYFVPESKLYELKFPVDYKLKETAKGRYGFTTDDAIGSYFISVVDRDGRAQELYDKMKANPRVKTYNIGGKTVSKIEIQPTHSLGTVSWHFMLGDHPFLVTYTYDTIYKETTAYNDDIDSIKSIIESMELIPPGDRDQRYAWYRLGSFLKGVGASDELLARATVNGSFIECVVLLANQIDSLLRMGIILKKQINNNNRDIDIRYLYQGENDKVITERTIYREANEIGVIDDEFHDDLEDLYDERNKVIHRYIISDITTKKVLGIAYEYSQLASIAYDIVYDLEREQAKNGLGMTIDKIPIDADKMISRGKIYETAISEKHDGIDFENPLSFADLL